MKLTQRAHHRRHRRHVVQMAWRTRDGKLLLVERPADADGYPGFFSLPERPEDPTPGRVETADAPRIGTDAPRIGTDAASSPRLDAVHRPNPADEATAPPRLIGRFAYPPMTRVRTTVTVFESGIEPRPAPAEGVWIDPSDLHGQWIHGAVALDPIVVAYLEQTDWTHHSNAMRDRNSGATTAPAATSPGDRATIQAAAANGFWRARPDVWVLPLKTLTIPPADRTNTYLIAGSPMVVIDPGTRFPAERTRLDRMIDALHPGTEPLQVILTHHHEDHLGAVSWLRRRRRLEVMAHPETAVRALPDIQVDRLLAHGTSIAAGRRRLSVVYTPGHAPGHICLHDPSDGTLFAGDMLAGIGTVVIDPSDGSLSDYLDALDRLLGLKLAVIFPAHGPPIGTPRAHIEAYKRHRTERSEAILRLLQAGPRSADAIARRLYRDLPYAARKMGARSVSAHLAYLEQQGRVRRRGRKFEWVPAGDRRGTGSA